MLKEKVFIVVMIIFGVIITTLSIISKNTTTTLCDIAILVMWIHDYYDLMRRDK